VNRARAWLAENWWWLLPVLLGIVIMLPRLLSPQFGVEDDSISLRTAERALQSAWTPAEEAATGRFRPMYWLWFAGVYALAGPRPGAFFAANLLILMLTGLGLAILVRQNGGTKLQAGFAGGLFVLSGPVIESYYTTSKSEPAQTLWLVGALLAAHYASRAGSRGWLLLLAILSALCLELALLTKETTIVIAAISAAWLLLDLWLRRWGFNRVSLVLLGCSAVAVLIFFGLRGLFVPNSIAGGQYTGQYELLTALILAQMYRWGGWLIRDYPFLLFALLLLPFLLKGGFFRETNPLLVASLVWMLGWAVVFLPWIFMAEYYMLPFSLGASVLAGVIFGAAADRRRSDLPVLRAGLLGGAFILFLSTLANNASAARLQLTIDRENERMLEYVSHALGPGDVLAVAMAAGSPYIEHIGLHLAYRGLGSTSVMAFDPHSPPAGPYLAVAPHIKNEPLFFVRLGTFEEESHKWDAVLKSVIGSDTLPVFETETTYKQSNVNLVALVCPLVALEFCQSGTPLLDTRNFSYGWKAYTVNAP
jgi:hypothetical protein